MKKAAKKGAEKAVTAAATKTGEHVGKKGGDKIVKMLSKSGESKKIPKKINLNDNVSVKPVRKKMTHKEINQRVNPILSGGKICKRKII